MATTYTVAFLTTVTGQPPQTITIDADSEDALKATLQNLIKDEYLATSYTIST